ncbi:GTP-binding protein [Fusobacterium pseudoperiodonticum]|uniref:GTP-binding protein n=1 Tax=Fusobacterium pseudoperiodonticum TaxID=2663009 RepID=UPI0028EEE535|nr:GTP-binding protein [Fusobacterium pseudoperiodonticum]
MKILLVSGFLGAGKTTFIKEMAKNINLEFVVLENEYADIGVDKDFLNEKNLDVWEMSEGCICCSMKGDFKSSIKRIYSEINPEYLLIEPTGLGMLSSIIENIKELNNEDIEILRPISLIDVTSFDEYLESFNNFFLDNLKNTGKVILTKLENISPIEVKNIKNRILELNADLEIETNDYRNYPKEWFAELLNRNLENKVIDKNFSMGTHINLRTFSKENINLKTMDELGLLLNRLVNGDFGKVYRAKGIIEVDGYWGKFNLVYKNFEMEAIEKAEVTKIVVIGNNLDIENLKNI